MSEGGPTTPEDIAPVTPRKPINTFRVARQFERFLGIDLNGPRDDQGMASDEWREYQHRKPRYTEFNPEESRLIARGRLDPMTGEIKWTRLPELSDSPHGECF